MAVNNINRLLYRGKLIAKQEGTIGLVKRSIAYFVPYIFRHEHVYLYKNPTDIQIDSVLVNPKRQDVKCEIITSNWEADRLSRDYIDIRDVMFDAGKILDRGGVAICLFIGRDLAHISWLGMNQEARKVIDSIPYEIDFSNGQACTGKTFTNPKYRGQNLMVYGNYKKLQYLKEKGIIYLLHAVGVDNIASQKGYGKFTPVIYSELWYFYLLGIKYRKEKRLIET